MPSAACFTEVLIGVLCFRSVSSLWWPRARLPSPLSLMHSTELEAANLANEIASGVALRRSSSQPTAADALAALNVLCCLIPTMPVERHAINNAASSEALVTDWADKVIAALPGASAHGLQVDTTTPCLQRRTGKWLAGKVRRIVRCGPKLPCDLR